MGRLPGLTDLQEQEGQNIKVSSFVLARASSVTRCPAGTRCVSVTYSMGPDVYSGDPDTRRGVRLKGEATARTRAVEAWEKRWGPLPWDLVTIVASHVTYQVSYQLSVEP